MTGPAWPTTVCQKSTDQTLLEVLVQHPAPYWDIFLPHLHFAMQPAGGEDTDAQQSPALMQLQHLWHVGAGIGTALRISTLRAKYCLSQLVCSSLTLHPYLCRKTWIEINSDKKKQTKQTKKTPQHQNTQNQQKTPQTPSF